MIKKEALKIKVKEACLTYSFRTLVSEIKSKGRDLSYQKLEIQNYFISDKVRPDQAILLFRIKSSMMRVKVNYKNLYGREDENQKCSLCQKEVETLEHAVSTCESLDVKMTRPYKDLFSHDEEKWVAALIDFEKIWRKREEISDNKALPKFVDQVYPLSSFTVSH